jgi:hypothetical protein
VGLDVEQLPALDAAGVAREAGPISVLALVGLDVERLHALGALALALVGLDVEQLPALDAAGVARLGRLSSKSVL